MCCGCCCRSPKAWLCSATLCALLSVVSLMGAFGAFMLYRKYTPVYTDVDCRLRAPKIHKMSFAGGFHVDFTTNLACYNPNPYEFTLRSAAPFDVYMGAKVVKVATVNSIPENSMKPGGTGETVVDVKMQPTRQSWGVFFGTMFTKVTPIYIDMALEFEFELDMYIQKMVMKKDFVKHCGFNLQMFRGGAMAKVGPLACADTWDALVTFPVDDAGFNGRLELNSEEFAQNEVQEGEARKTMLFGGAAAAGALFGIIFLLGFLYCICNFRAALRRRHSRRRSGRPHGSPRSRGEALRSKMKMQAKELRYLKEQLAEEEMRRKMAARERKRRLLRARLAREEEGVSPNRRTLLLQQRQIRALKAKLAHTDAADYDDLDL